MIKLLKFIHEHLDLKDPHAVVVALVDLSKAFNRVSHQMVIEDLFDMKVPPWLLLILISYLTERSMILSYKGARSSPRSLPGSSPQGAFLGIFFFIVKYNGAALRPHIPRLMMSQCESRSRSCNSDTCVKHPKDTHELYIDDLSEGAAINLKKQLVKDTVQRTAPLNYHERTGHVLPAGSLLQRRLDTIETFTKNNKMKINESKSKVMLFNKSKRYDFPLEFSFQNGVQLECIETTKLLGIFLTTDLRWEVNSREIYQKAMKKMWLLRRLKKLKLDLYTILDFYLKEIRPVSEHGVAVWHSGLTKNQSNEIEKIQKVAFRIILGENYISYDAACILLNVMPLRYRRTELCTSFAIKLYKSSRSADFFLPAKRNVNLRNKNKNLVIEQKCNTKRLYNAPHNYLARLINDNTQKISK